MTYFMRNKPNMYDNWKLYVHFYHAFKTKCQLMKQLVRILFCYNTLKIIAFIIFRILKVGCIILGLKKTITTVFYFTLKTNCHLSLVCFLKVFLRIT